MIPISPQYHFWLFTSNLDNKSFYSRFLWRIVYVKECRIVRVSISEDLGNKTTLLFVMGPNHLSGIDRSCNSCKHRSHGSWCWFQDSLVPWFVPLQRLVGIGRWPSACGRCLQSIRWGIWVPVPQSCTPPCWERGQWGWWAWGHKLWIKEGGRKEEVFDEYWQIKQKEQMGMEVCNLFGLLVPY